MNNAYTVKNILRWAQKELSLSSDTAILDSKVLFRNISGFSDVDLIVKADEIIDQQLLESYKQIVMRRKQGMPIAYITGQKEFWSLNFKVTIDTLIPRPETELLVETALKFIPNKSDFTIADLGTGSGAIACAIASERPNVNIVATDKSVAALEVAQENAINNRFSHIRFIQSDWFEKIAGKKFNLIVSNPPYVVENDKHLKQGDVRFEPDLALTPGSDSLRDLRLIISHSGKYLKPNGCLIVEHGYDQCTQVCQLYNNNGYENITCLKDLNNRPRITYGNSSNEPM